MYLKLDINQKIYSILLLTKLFIIVYCFIYNIDFFENMQDLITYLKTQNEINNNENYLKYCGNRQVQTINKFKKVNDPKISIISPIYNKDRYILRFLKSIQYQNFDDLEIIFVDDNSIDLSVDLIEKYQKDDERIVLIKNGKNKGTFISRNLGVMSARGKYVLIADSDDILSKDILNICYQYAEEHQYDMIRYNMYLGKQKGIDKIDFDEITLIDRPVFQPELSTYLFYGNNNELQIIDSYITNKLIKTDVYIKAVNSLSEEYLNMFITYLEDSMMNYILYRTANSLYFIKKIGYYWTQNSQSINANLYKMNDLRLKYSFAFFKLIYEYSKNTKYEKDMANLLFTDLNRNFNMMPRLNSWKGDLNYFNDIVDSYLHNIYITDENKYILEDFKNIIEKKNKTYYKELEKQKKNQTLYNNLKLNDTRKTNDTKKKK